MSKRSSFEKIPKGFYPTIDPKAIPPNFLKYVKGKTIAEPSYGGGDLWDLLKPQGVFCGWKSDLRDVEGAYHLDGLKLTGQDIEKCDVICTNPDFSKDVLLPLIDHWTSLGKPVWLLLPADYLHNGYFKPYMERCSNVVSIGRLFWFKNTWVVKHEFSYDELDTKWDKNVEYFDMVTGRKYYTGWITQEGKPCKSEFVRGTDNYIWACFHDTEQTTIFETRGD